MKTILVLFSITVISLLAACNSNPQTSATNTEDTAMVSTSTDSSSNMMQTSPLQDTAQMGSDLMKAMSDMMANMQSMQMTGDFDADFANMLIEHHQGAIDMAKVEVAGGKDEKMKAMAQELIAKQTDEQAKLKDIIKNYKPSGMKHGEGELQKGMAVMSSKMKTIKMSGDVDKDFATMMASHHEDGIAMSEKEVRYGMNAQLKQMAQKGITDQKKDISELNTWLLSHR